MSDMGKCDPEIYNHGVPVAMIADRNAQAIQDLVETIAQQTKQRIDWHYVGGRGIVKVIGNSDLVRDAFRPYCNAWLQILDAAL